MKIHQLSPPTLDGIAFWAKGLLPPVTTLGYTATVKVCFWSYHRCHERALLEHCFQKL